jgi:UDP-2,3-diacylglucosamine hydrolase
VASLFISDLHLTEAHPAITRMLFGLLLGAARDADALYILGDLFEYWAGDDDLDEPLNRDVSTALRELADSGVAIYFMAGNRDFLIGEDYARRSGLTLLADPALVDLDGTPTLLMHGDTLCTDDAAYLQFRSMVRTPAYIAQFLAQPLAARKTQIAAIRNRSEAEKHAKDAGIMDVNRDAVIAAMRGHGSLRLIHGHTHRPAEHRLDIDGAPASRIVLADWQDARGEYLRCDGGDCSRIELRP